MTDNDITRFKQILTQHNYHLTKAREATFRLLLGPEPQSINQLLSKANGTVDRVSVYRNLELFEKLGLVHRMYVGWKYKFELSDEFLAHHHHLSCLDCGQVIDIEDEQHIDEFIQTVAATFHFLPRRHQFEVDGYCQECAPKAAKP